MKKMRITALTAAMVFLLTGCGNPAETQDTTDNSKIAQEIDNIENGDESDATGDTLATMLKLEEEKWIETFEVPGNNFNQVKVGASVEIPNANRMSVVSLKKLQFDAARKQALVEAICEKESIYSFDDTVHPKWYYEHYIKIKEKDIQDILAAKDAGISYISGGGEWSAEDDQLYSDEQKDLKEWKDMYANAPELGEDVGDYSANNYTGMKDGHRVVFYFHEDSVSWNMVAFNEFSKKKDNAYDNIEIYADDTDYGNLCNISEEEAGNEAMSYISKLGYTEYVVDKVKPLMWENYSLISEDSRWTDGYVVYLARNVNGIAVDYTDYGKNNMTMDGMQEQRIYNGGEYIEVYLNDTGVLRCSINHPREVVEELSANTLLLSYEQIKNVMKTILLDKAKNYDYDADGDTLVFSHMELIYYAMSDEEDQITLLPAWRLSSIEDNVAWHPLLLNAIDGNEIDVWEDSE